jgi:hypothetical protein
LGKLVGDRSRRDGGAFVLSSAIFLSLSAMDPVKRGQVRGDFSKVADIRIIDESPLYEYCDPTTDSLRFIFLDKALHGQRLSVQIDTTEKGNGKEFFELIGSSKRISDLYLTDTGPHSNLIQWNFDYEHRTVKDGNVIIFAEADQLDENLLPKQTHAFLKTWPSLIDTAVAQSNASVPPAQPSAGTPSELPSAAGDPVAAESIRYIADLKSDDPTVRRNARDALVGLGTQAIPPLMKQLRTDTADYRVKGGYYLRTIHYDNESSGGEIRYFW